MRWFARVDAALAERGLVDPGTVRIDGFPQLRVDRFLASLKDHAMLEPEFAAWLESLRRLDAATRPEEFANLPTEAAQALLAAWPPGESFEHAMQRCGQRLLRLSLSRPEYKRRILQSIDVPDAYQTWKRYLGVYAVAQYAAAWGVARLHRELAESFRKPAAQLPVQGRLLRYRPPQDAALRRASVGTLMQRAYDNPLAVPELTPQQMQQLFEHFAPLWEIDTRNDGDKIGRVLLDIDGMPRIYRLEPTVYVAHAFTRRHGKVLLQLIYQVWFPEREKTGMFDLYGGPLDSVVWRVTLSPEGAPIAYDSIHACGCYYMLFPGPGYRAIAPRDGAEAVLSPKLIPSLQPGQRLLLRLQSRTHYLQQVTPVADAGHDASTYVWQEAEQLRSLPLPGGARRSLFGNDGVVEASERSERFLLWPFGVASPGAMRQWGTHAIAFTGRRHFDDAFLLEKLLGDD